MTDVLTWTVQQRLELEERAELLRTEPAGISSARPGRSSEITADRTDRSPAVVPERSSADGPSLAPETMAISRSGAARSVAHRSCRGWGGRCSATV
jgi:hypothetical protein